MADRERLRLTLRRRTNDREFRPVDVVEDPTDTDALIDLLVDLARREDGRGSDLWWVGEYEVKVESLDRQWRKPFTVAGRGV